MITKLKFLHKFFDSVWDGSFIEFFRKPIATDINSKSERYTISTNNELNHGDETITKDNIRIVADITSVVENLYSNGIAPIKSIPYLKSITPSNNPTVQAFLDKIASDTLTAPSQSKINIYNAAFDYADSEGLTSKIDLLGLMKVENIDLCTIPFIHINDTIRFGIINDIVFTPNVGFKSDGTSYIDTNWAESQGVNYQLGDASYGFYTPETVNDYAQSPFGETVSYAAAGPSGPNIEETFIIQSYNSYNTTIVLDTIGLRSCSVKNDTNKLYRNGIEIDNYDNGGATYVLSTQNMYVGAINNSDPETFYTGGNIQLFFTAAGDIDQAKLNTFITMLLLD